jgi:predicted amidohydrolase
VIVPTANTINEPREVFECELRASAFQNGVFVAMCNGIGGEGDAVFCWESTLVDPNGKVVVKAGICEELLIADINTEEAALARKERPYLSLRRTEMYA